MTTEFQEKIFSRADRICNSREHRPSWLRITSKGYLVLLESKQDGISEVLITFEDSALPDSDFIKKVQAKEQEKIDKWAKDQERAERIQLEYLKKKYENQ